MEFTPPVDTWENNLCPLCLLNLSVLCLVFVRTSFLQNPEKSGICFADQRLYVCICSFQHAKTLFMFVHSQFFPNTWVNGYEKWNGLGISFLCQFGSFVYVL